MGRAKIRVVRDGPGPGRIAGKRVLPGHVIEVYEGTPIPDGFSIAAETPEVHPQPGEPVDVDVDPGRGPGPVEEPPEELPEEPPEELPEEPPEKPPRKPRRRKKGKDPDA